MAEIQMQKMTETLADRVHNAYLEYRRIVFSELEPAIEAIVGEDRLACAHVESDSQHDWSVEVALEGGGRLTPDERARIKALGFYTVWNDEHSGDSDDASPREVDRLRRVVTNIVTYLRETQSDDPDEVNELLFDHILTMLKQDGYGLDIGTEQARTALVEALDKKEEAK